MGELLHALHTRGTLPARFVAAQSPAGSTATPPRFFSALSGRRPQFLSQTDADAYDQGWAIYPGAAPDEPATTPRSRGYADRAIDTINANNARDIDAVDGVVNRLAAIAAGLGVGYVVFVYFLLPLFFAAS